MHATTNYYFALYIALLVQNSVSYCLPLKEKFLETVAHRMYVLKLLVVLADDVLGLLRLMLQLSPQLADFPILSTWLHTPMALGCRRTRVHHLALGK